MAARIIRYFAELLDTLISGTPAEKDVLSRDATSGKWVNRTLAQAGIAPLASPGFTGVPTAPTAVAATDSIQLATTAFVQARIAQVINTAPANLDTLGEIATALAADESTTAALVTTVSGKLAKASNLSDLTDVATARINLSVYSIDQVNSTFDDVATAFDEVYTTIGNLSAIYAPIADPTFTGNVHLNNLFITDDNDVVLGTLNGTMIGTATNQKLAFFGSTPVVKPTGNIITALSNLGLVGTPTIAEADVTNLVTDLAAKAPLASPAFTGTVTLPITTMGDGSNISFGTTTGTKIGTATGQKFAFYNSTPIIKPTGNILTALTNLGLVTTPTIAESDVTSLTSDLALKAPLASPTFTGTVGASVIAATGNVTAANLIQSKSITFDGGGSVITVANSAVTFSLPVGATIVGWDLTADASGSMVVEIDKSTYAGYPTMTSIVAAAKPTLSGAQKGTDATLTGWTTTVAAGDVFKAYLSGTPATITKATLTLKFKLT